MLAIDIMPLEQPKTFLAIDTTKLVINMTVDKRNERYS